MKNLFIGFILIFLDFSINIGNSKIGLIPDFVGYIIMINGLTEMEGESTLFAKVKPYVSIMAVYSGILYFLDLIGVSVSLSVLTYILAFTSLAVSLYISYQIVMGVIDMEGKYNTTFNGSRLKSTWTLLAVFNVLAYALSLIPMLSMICVIAALIINVYFLVNFNTSKNLYYNTVR